MEHLLKQASRLMQAGNVRLAEEMYKKIIKQHPDCKEAYQQLWNSWVAHRSLRVPQREMDHFLCLYNSKFGFHSRK